MSKDEKSKMVTVAFAAPLETSINETVPLASLAKVESVDSVAEVETKTFGRIFDFSNIKKIFFVESILELKIFFFC